MVALPVYRNAGDSGSFFAAQQESPTTNPLIATQVDPSDPQVNGLTKVSSPVQPAHNAEVYVKNFDPVLYDLRNTSHLMRLLRAITGAAGVGGLRKQNIVARLSALLSDGSFLDLDKFYGVIFGLQRHSTESMPSNVDGTTVDPYLDLANSDVWDDVRSRDARYRSRLYLLARAVNMGATMPGLRLAAEAVINYDVDVVESWVRTDLMAQRGTIVVPSGQTYFNITSQYVTYGGINQSYGTLQGSVFGGSQLPAGNRGELIFSPRRPISQEERHQLTQVLNTLKPSHTQITIADPPVANAATVVARGYSSDSENWQIQARVTPALNLIDPAIPVYNNAGPYSLARPVFSEYSGESWTYTPNVVRSTSYRLNNGEQQVGRDREVVSYADQTSHVYAEVDGLIDARQSMSLRLSGEGPVTAMPYSGPRPDYSFADGVT